MSEVTILIPAPHASAISDSLAIRRAELLVAGPVVHHRRLPERFFFLRDGRGGVAGGALSAGWAGRSKRVFFPKFFTFSRGMVEGIKGVHTGPGATPLTRTPFLIAISARVTVMLAMAALVAA